ncbi:glycerophosphocholine phosphodiesterase GPCPD1-like isoform 2-T2 [Cochliomyia hominivorax]
MHRWFFANDEIVCKDPTPPPSSPKIPPTPSTSSIPETDWIFKVYFDWELCCNEIVAVTGSTPNLGNWDVQRCVPLERGENSSYWTLRVTLPRKDDIRYRYLVCGFNDRNRKIVRFWESHNEARLIASHQTQDVKCIERETFGILNSIRKIERGWINSYITMLQFKFYQSPFVLKSNLDKILLYVKITPLRMKSQEKCTKEALNDRNHDNDEYLSNTFAYSEVASLQDQDDIFHRQPKYGTECGPDDLLIFNLTLGDMEHTAYEIDLYKYTPKAGADIPPQYFGYQYVLPQEIKASDGTMQLIIMCATKHRPIGTMKCDYLTIRSLHSLNLNMEKTFQRYWNTKDETILIGHRGCGNSFWYENDILRENTINSFNLAYEHGADMVEFDIQLTKDMIPILYHDFLLYVTKNYDISPQDYDIMHLPLMPSEIQSLKKIGDYQNEDLISYSLNQFTLEQLKRVQVYKPPKSKNKYSNCGSKNIKNNQPFVTLEDALREVNNKLGFVIEIKWPQKLVDGTMQDSFLQDIDKNDFIDRILHVVFQNAGSRRIVFSSFDADICSMILVVSLLIVYILQKLWNF